jgi:hypothetical protein
MMIDNPTPYDENRIVGEFVSAGIELLRFSEMISNAHGSERFVKVIDKLGFRVLPKTCMSGWST